MILVNSQERLMKAEPYNKQETMSATGSWHEAIGQAPLGGTRETSHSDCSRASDKFCSDRLEYKIEKLAES